VVPLTHCAGSSEAGRDGETSEGFVRHRELINPYHCGGTGPIRREWALPLVVAGASAAVAVLAGSGVAHAEPDGDVAGSDDGGFAGVDAADSFADDPDGVFWDGSSTGDRNEGELVASSPPAPGTAAGADAVVELPEPPDPDLVTLDDPDLDLPDLDLPDAEQPAGSDTASWAARATAPEAEVAWTPLDDPFPEPAADPYLDAPPELRSTGWEPVPPTGAVGSGTAGVGTSFSGWTGPEDTGDVETALGEVWPSWTTPSGAPSAARVSDVSGDDPDPAVAAGEAPGLPSPVGTDQRSSRGSGTEQASIRFGPDGERTDQSNVLAEQAAMLASLGTEEGRRRLQDLFTAERVVADPDGLDLFVADVAERLRRLAIGSDPLTREQAGVLYPIPSQDPFLAVIPESMRPTFQDYYDQQNAELADRAMASHWGFQAPELACWVACYNDGTARVLPELHVGLNYQVGGSESTLDELDLTHVTDLISLHTHPLFATADPPESYNTTGLSAADIAFLDSLRPDLPPHVEPAEASVSLLEGTVTIVRRDPAPEAPPGSEENPDGVRGPLRVRVLPSTPGSPVSSEIKIQVDDPGTLDFSLADAAEAPGVSEQRYTAARRAAETGLDPTALTDLLDLYGPGVVPPGLLTADGLRSRGLVIPPPAAAIDLPLPTDTPGRSVDPDVNGDWTPSAAPYGRDESGAAIPTGTEETDAPTRPDTAPGASSTGVVIRPEPGLTPQEQADLGLLDLPGGWATVPPVPLPDLTIPDGRPVDPEEFDPNRVQHEEPLDPEIWTVPETFPNQPADDLEQHVWTFPPLPDESPVDAEQPTVEPIPSPPGMVPSPALADRPADRTAQSRDAGSAPAPSGTGDGWDLGRWVSDRLSDPVTMTRSADGTTYQAVGGVPFTPSSYVGVYDAATGELVAAEKGTPPSRVDTGQYMDPATGVAVAAVAAAPWLAPRLLPAAGGGTLAGAGGWGAVLPVLPVLAEPAPRTPEGAAEAGSAADAAEPTATEMTGSADSTRGAPDPGVEQMQAPETVGEPSHTQLALPQEDGVVAQVVEKAGQFDHDVIQPAWRGVQDAVQRTTTWLTDLGG